MKALTLLEVVGLAALVGGGLLVISALPEIRRYLCIRSM
jgi:hypothetical protein